MTTGQPTTDAATDAGLAPRVRAALLVVLLLAALLRLPALDRVPGPLHPDEAANAADALDLLERPAPTFARETDRGPVRDEGTYVWVAAPFVRAGVLPVEAAVRLPAALAGLGLVAAAFALGRALGGARVGLLAALLVAVEPWAVHLSRLALRGALVPPLVAAGLLLLAARRPGDARRAWLGGGLLASAAATYPPARLVLPPLALAWVLLEPAPALPARRRLAPLLPLGLVFLALLPWTLGPEGGARLGQVALAPAGPLEAVAGAARGWALHHSTRFLWSGATSRGFAPEGVGLLLLVEAPLLLLGLAALRRHPQRGRLLAWLLLFPAAAALTVDVPNALRAVPALPLHALLAALGADLLARRLPARAARPALALVAGLVVGQGLAAHARHALVHPVREARFYFAGRRELAEALGRRAALGEAWRAPVPFLAPYLRLHAPAAPVRDGVVGPGAPRGRVVLLEDEPPRAGDEPLAPGIAVVRPDRRQ